MIMTNVIYQRKVDEKLILLPPKVCARGQASPSHIQLGARKSHPGLEGGDFGNHISDSRFWHTLII